ncbi:histidine phosphatase family protein [Streptomyces sp. NPDC056061]|uniref:histidine phosphatase family protein n=1 Tax=Streptomyces sp. NPDC056061 TaxID=3345700 RepID=UPI0035DAF46A
MTEHVMMISPALNAALREARFDGDAPLDPAGHRHARKAASAVPSADRYVCGPSGRCTGTAEALGLRAVTEPVLRGWDMGRWAGRRLADVGADEPDAVSAWLADPSAAPHGGESLLAFCGRIGAWLESVPDPDGGDRVRTVAVVEPAVVRASVVRALALPTAAFWRLDVAPLTLTGLSGRSGRWNLSCGHPLSPAGAR